MERRVNILQSPTLCTWCTHESTGMVPTGGCRMVSGRTAGMRTGCGWTGMSGVVRQGGDRTHGSCCGGRTSWGGRDLIQLRPYERGAYCRSTTCGSRATDPSVAAGRESDVRAEWCRLVEPGGREEGGRSHAGGGRDGGSGGCGQAGAGRVGLVGRAGGAGRSGRCRPDAVRPSMAGVDRAGSDRAERERGARRRHGALGASEL